MCARSRRFYYRSTAFAAAAAVAAAAAAGVAAAIIVISAIAAIVVARCVRELRVAALNDTASVNAQQHRREPGVGDRGGERVRC